MAAEQGATETVGWGHMWARGTPTSSGEPERAVAHAQQAVEIAERHRRLVLPNLVVGPGRSGGDDARVTGSRRSRRSSAPRRSPGSAGQRRFGGPEPGARRRGAPGPRGRRARGAAAAATRLPSAGARAGGGGRRERGPRPVLLAAPRPHRARGDRGSPRPSATTSCAAPARRPSSP